MTKNDEFLSKYANFSGSERYFNLPDNEEVELVLTAWRFEKDARGKNKVVFDVVSARGKPTKQIKDENGDLVWPTFSVASKRLARGLERFIQDAIEKKEGSIHVWVKKVTGTLSTDTHYFVRSDHEVEEKHIDEDEFETV